MTWIILTTHNYLFDIFHFELILLRLNDLQPKTVLKGKNKQLNEKCEHTSEPNDARI